MIMRGQAPTYGERLRILVLEDNDCDYELLLRELARGGYAACGHRVQTEAQLKDALAAGPWDIVLCDYRLPSFDSVSALALVRAHATFLPFVLVSGYIG